ncbi:unnamed protein product [Blepharisma stoltei]|uniref:Exosome complex component RRP45 n=1 Tax=Blepharisma stoltei TaxID=1481888 RepID=A0AAU9JFD1_9CILI|nr:unnamed protein product [Blepharisma stoltei]
MEDLSTNERNFILLAIKESKQRLDGRGLYDYRRLSVQFHNKRGSCEVALGDTLVYACVNAFIDKPYADRPHEGFFTFTVNFLPMAHPNFEQILGSTLSNKNRRIRNEISQEIERLLEKTLKRANALNVESLCIYSGKYAWNIQVHLHILSHNGNLLDACTIAALLSLSHTRIPETKILPSGDLQFLPKYKPLSLHFLPICITFGFLSDGIIILDPLIKEESVLEGRLMISMNIYGDILTLQKTGAACVGASLLMECIEVARLKVKDITKSIRTALEAAKDIEPEQFEINAERADRLVEDLISN